MRALVLVLLAALAATALGCQESGFDERKETARPLKVQHILGETKVPGRADRPATLTVDALDDTLALKVKPVRAALPGRRVPAYLRVPAKGVALMRPVVRRADLPALAAMKPDLILGGEDEQGGIYASLSKIAPTVMTEGGSLQWKLNMRLVGEALGRTNDAEALLTDYDRRVAGTRDALRGRPTVAVARRRADSDGLRFAPRESFAGTVLADAGLKQATSARHADLVLLSGGSGGSLRQFDGRVVPVDLATWWGPGGMLQARAALGDLRRTARR